LAPFDPDEICQAIFAATEQLRRPNAFLAREMTESVLHFVTHDFGASTPTTTQLAELLDKVLRELGHAALAQVMQERGEAIDDAAKEPDREEKQPVIDRTASLPAYLSQWRRQFSLQVVHSRDLEAAQDEGWLTLIGLDHPSELEGGVVDWPSSDGRSLLSAILEAQRRFGGFLVLDGPEHALARASDSRRALAEFVRDLHDGWLATGLPLIINLNAAQPPAWAQPPGDGPLFGGGSAPSVDSQSMMVPLFDAILETLGTAANAGSVRIDWHFGERDFASGHLQQVLDRALAGLPISFVLDRPHAPVALAEGLDRRHPVALQAAGLHLGPLADKQGIEGQVEPFLQNLLHLTRMAVSAGAQKRQFLRRAEERDLQRGFLLDRARLTVIPVGLPAVVERLTGQTIASGKQGLTLARKIVERLSECLREAGHMANLEAVLDGPWWTARQPGTGPLLVSPHLVGLTCADFSATAEDQLRAAGVLHKIAGAGTVTLLATRGRDLDVEQLADLLHFALRKTDLVRVRLARRAFENFAYPVR